MDDDNNLTPIVRVVDNLIICHQDPAEYDCLANKLQDKMIFPLNFFSTVYKFNGVNIDQMCNLITYIVYHTLIK